MGVNQGALTRANGVFDITNVVPGTYRIRADRVGLTLGSQDITVADGATVEVTFELDAQAIGLNGYASDGSVIPRGSDRPVEQTPPPTPPVRTPEQLRETPSFTPHSVRPELTNAEEIMALLRTEYPTAMRESGLGGTATVWLFINAEGVVQNMKLQTPIGVPALDAGALKIAQAMRFTPAFNRDQKVAVWVSVPISFRP
jgi:TonB family protein